MAAISVVITTYNRAEMVTEAVRSVLAQTHPVHELIVVDDGSTDATPQRLTEFGARIRVLRQSNRERGAARNAGLAAATGEWVAFLDSDDQWLPGKLAAESAALEADPELTLVYSDAWYVSATGRRLGRVAREPANGAVLERLVKGNFISFGAHLLRADCFRACGGFSEDRTMSGAEDWEAWCRLAHVGRFRHVPHAGLLYRLHPGGSVADPAGMERAMEVAFRTTFANPVFADRIRPLEPSARASMHLMLCSLYYGAHQMEGAARQFQLAAAAHPPVCSTPRYRGMAMRLELARRLPFLAAWRRIRRG